MIHEPTVPVLVRGTPRLDDIHSHGGTSKLWRLPDGRWAPVKDMHYRWVQVHRAWLRSALGLTMSAVAAHVSNEQPPRAWAVRRGLVRVNFNRRDARLVVECVEDAWTASLQGAVRRLVKANACVEVVRVHVLRRRDLVAVEVMEQRVPSR